MRHRALQISLSIVAALLVGCSTSDFPTTPSPVAETPLTTLAALKVDGSASLPGGGQTLISMTLIARSLDATASEIRAQTPGTTEVSGNFVLGTGVTGTVSGSIEGSLENGTLHGALRSNADGCTRQYDGPISTAGISWLAADNTGNCPLPITVQASRAGAPSACTYAISPVGAVPGGGTTTVLTITTGPRCTWVVEAQAPWLSFTGPSTGMGPGTVTLVVDPSDVPRQGTVLVAGQSLSIDQTPACTIAVAPQTISFPESGGSRPLTVTTQARCDWRAENTPNWLAVSPAGGTGTTTLTLVAQPNSGADREASLRVGGQTVAITQAGPSGGPAPCIEGVTLSAAAFQASGGTGSIDIVASQACAWSAQADVPWIVITGGSGSGAGRISFTVQPNPGSERTGAIRVGGRVLTITQVAPAAPPPCDYRISVSPNAFPATGGTGTVAVTVTDQCEWVVESIVDWIKVQTGAARGSGSAQFIVAANPTGTPRQGELRVAGQSFIVTQQPLLAPVTVTLISGCGEIDDGECIGDYGGGTVVGPEGFSCSIPEIRDADSPGPSERRQVCSANFPVGFSVTFTAMPGSNSDFREWGGACMSAQPTCTFIVTAAGTSVTATFFPEPILEVFVDSGDTTVTSNPAGINCRNRETCSAQFETGTEVVLDAGAPDALWSGCDTPAPGMRSATCRVRLTGNKSVRVFFNDITPVRIRETASGGTSSVPFVLLDSKR